jgi:pimeloyl-[acyl-carrier protein] methyl ester esterase
MHITVRGEGPDLVMLHGWSMHSAVWHDLADALASRFTLHLVDLPGHGQSDWLSGDFELERLLAQLANRLPQTAYWLGWSLGGLISLAFSNLFPERVNKLLLLAATPCFVQKPDWRQAMQDQVFLDFADKLAIDQADALQRFLLLQARGSLHSRETIKALAAQLVALGPAHSEALADGLSLLINLDMRAALSDLACPVKLVLGERDTLIPQTMAADALLLNAALETELIAGAGHAPFISHPTECLQAVMTFFESEKQDD